jgi:hypothetical protein
LSDVERTVIAARYGANDAEPWADLADRLGYSRASLHRVERRALGRLRERLTVDAPQVVAVA